MRIINRKEFLTLPNNTIYSKYEACCFGDLSIKDETIGDDFICLQIKDSIEIDDDMDFISTLSMCEYFGDSIEMDFDSGGRDGCFDEEQRFAIWEKRDIEKLIEALKKAVECSKSLS